MEGGLLFCGPFCISSTSKEIPFTVWNMKVHYHVQNHLFLYSVRWIRLIPSHPIHLRSNTILYSHLYKGFLSALFPSYFPTKTHQPSTGSYFESFELCKVHIFPPASIPGDVTGDFFHGSPRWNHVPWGRLSLWKWVPGISPGVKAAGAYGWRTTTLAVPNVKKIQGLNLPRTPWATLACCRMTFTFTYLPTSFL